MKRILFITALLVMAAAIAGSLFVFSSPAGKKREELPRVDFSLIPNDKFGDVVKYGRELILNTAYYIGPEGIRGSYLGNKMNCGHCHQEAGTKPFSFNLLQTHARYPQYRSREARVLTLADRINNCVERPHNGRPLPPDSPEMVALLSYFKWINGFAPPQGNFPGAKNLDIQFPAEAASPDRGRQLFALHCQLCHGANGEGQLRSDSVSYAYPPLWGPEAYQRGSSMHRIIKMAQWLKANMPYGKASWDKPFLSDAEALDLAAFINDDSRHPRPGKESGDYPVAEEKAIDYDRGPFADSFPASQHKFGPFDTIIQYWKKKGMKPSY